MSTYGFDENKCKKEVYDKEKIDDKLNTLERMEYNLKAKTYNENGVFSDTYETARIVFLKRNGMVLAIFLISPVTISGGNICLFNEDDTPFVIPDKYKALRNHFPKIIDNFNLENENQLLKASVGIGEMTFNEKVIFNGTSIGFSDCLSSTPVSGNLFFMKSMYYMSEEV